MRAITVSGIDGVTFNTWDVDRVSDTEVTVELSFDGNITTNATLTFTVGADAIAGYGGSAFTAQIPVTGGDRINSCLNDCTVDRGNAAWECGHTDTDTQWQDLCRLQLHSHSLGVP